MPALVGRMRALLSSTGLSGGGGGGGSVSAEAQQFFDRITDPGATRKTQYAALIDGLVADGVWSSIDVLHIYAADIQANALINLKSTSFSGAPTGSPAFSADHGFTFDGSSYIDTTFNPTTASGNYTQNAASLGVLTLTDPGFHPVVVYANNASGLNIYPRYADGNAHVRINDSPETDPIGPSDGLGFFLGVRTSSTGRTAYKDKVSLGTYGSAPSGALENSTFLVGQQSTGQIAVFVCGGNINAVQDKLFNRLIAYLTAVGAFVVVTGSALLMETGSALLLETGNKLLLG